MTIFNDGANSIRFSSIPAEAPPKEKCKWYHENTFVFGGKISDKERKALDKLLDALVKAIDAAANEASAVSKAIDELGPAGDVVDVVLLYACEDEDGNITRKKVTLDNTENIHWAAKAAKDPSNAQTQRTIIAKHTPQGSCCKPKPKTTNGIKTETANGVVRTTVETPQGEIRVNLPDDMAAGDTISGTVTAEPAGKNDDERRQNATELNGYVIEVGGQKITVRDKEFKWSIPTTLSPDAKTILLDHNGLRLATSEIPISNTPPATPTQFTLPTGGQQGRPIEIKGSCNGLFSPQDYVKIGGTIAPPLAESPRKIVVQNPSNTVGQTNIECKENGATAQCPFRNIGIKLSAPKLNLRRGETTTLHVEVLGLTGITQSLPLDLVNNSPNIIKMTGGEVQHTTIPSTQVQPNGTYSLDRTLTGILAGGFGITGTVTWADTCNNGPGGVIAGGPGPVLQPPPSPTPLTPTDTTSGEVCKWIAYKTYRVDEWKREQSNDKELEVRHGSAKGGGVTVEFHCKGAGTFTFTVTKESGSPDVVSVTCTQP